MNYYNEFDPYAAQWLWNLIDAGHIAKGDVDTRSIKDVRASDLTGYVQCHFFAGLGGWSHALRLAGWPDDRPVWTGSCPCQPFSAAGTQKGTADDRHLWPVWFNLIRECRPGVVFGEQVEAAVKHGWLDLVQTDLEGEGYACGAVGLPAGGVGAPHIRQRLWFVADAANNGHLAADGLRETLEPSGQAGAHGVGQFARGGDVDQLADSQCEGLEGYDGDGDDRNEPGRVNAQPARSVAPRSGVSRLDNRISNGRNAQRDDDSEHDRQLSDTTINISFWSDCDWLPCIDGKARPVEPGTFPLAHGATARVGRLRAYGNAIVPQVAQVFIEAYLDS